MGPSNTDQKQTQRRPGEWQGAGPGAGPGTGPSVAQDARAATVLARDPVNATLTATAQREADRPAGPDVRPSRPRATRILQRVDDRSPERANRQALDDLAAGADGLAIVFQGAPNAFGHGLPATPEALAAALHGVPLARTHLRMDVHPQSRASVDWLAHLLAARKVSPEKLDVSFGIDPAAIFAGTGVLRMSIEALMASLPQSLAHYFALGVPGVLLEADGRVFHNAGASDEIELGAMLASAIGFLRMFEEARQPALYAAAHIGFAVAVEQDRAAAAVKFAALHRLWERMLDSYGVPSIPVTIHAETSYRMLVSDDPEGNAARAALAALGAIDGGATTVAGLPHDIVHRLPDEGARARIRAALSVLAQEGGVLALPAVADAALEMRIGRLCEAAWDELRLIESEGGILRSVEDGRIQRRVLAARDARASAAGRLPAAHGAPAWQRNGHRDGAAGAAFCQRLDPIRWDEFDKAEAA